MWRGCMWLKMVWDINGALTIQRLIGDYMSSTEGLLKSLTSIVVKFDYFSVALIYCQLLFLG